MSRVTVRVPATAANIGPGFDTLGCAFSLYNRLTFETAEKTEILGCPPAFCGEDNLALVAFRAACRYAGKEAPAVRITIETGVPVSRGLGSSASMLVGGATGADLLLSLGLTKQDVLTIATDLEGHPDNIAPAVFGGFTAALMGETGTVAANFPIHPSLRFCAFVPDFPVETKAARAVLPKEIPFSEAVFNGTHLAVLMHALSAGDTSLLPVALQDRLHEPYRRTLIHCFDEVEAAARAAGAHAFFIGGSGPTCIAIYTDAGFPQAVTPAVSALPHNWQILPLEIDREGARAI